MKLDLQMFAEGDKSISLSNLQKFKEKCDEIYAKIGTEYNVLDLGTLTQGQTITLNDDQLALFQADTTVIKMTVAGTMAYLFKSYGAEGMVAYMMVWPYPEGISVLTLHSISGTQVQLTQELVNYARMDSHAIVTNNVLVWDGTQKVLKDSGFSKATVDGKYTKPSGGIPKTDLASAVQASLNKADSALQSVPDASTTVKGIALLGASGGSARYGQKADVGLSNVDNVKQYSASNEPPYPVKSVAGRTGAITLTKTDVGLSSVINTGDSATPTQNGTTKFTTGGAYTMQSTLQTAINSKANASEVVKKSGDTMTGNLITTGVEAGAFKSTHTDRDYVDFISGKGTSFGVQGANGTIYDLSNYLKRELEVSDSDDNYMGECSVRPSTYEGLNHMLLNLKGADGGSGCQIKVSDDNGPKLDIRYGYNSEPNGDFIRMASVNDLNNYMPKTGGTFTGDVTISDKEGSGEGVKLIIGDDAYICDIDQGNVIGLKSSTDSAQGGIKFGNGGILGYFGNGLTYDGAKLASETYVNNKMPTFSFRNGVLTITTH